MTTVEGGIAEAGGVQMCNCLQIVTEDLCVPCPNLLSKSCFGCKISKNPNLKLGFVILHSVVSTCLPISMIWISQFFHNNINRLVGGHRRSPGTRPSWIWCGVSFLCWREQLSCVTLSRWPNIVDIAPVTGGGACHTLSHVTLPLSQVTLRVSTLVVVRMKKSLIFPNVSSEHWQKVWASRLSKS